MAYQVEVGQIWVRKHQIGGGPKDHIRITDTKSKLDFSEVTWDCLNKIGGVYGGGGQTIAYLLKHFNPPIKILDLKDIYD